ncbi:protein-S-isoprenylcysteine O-methyltransferase [Megalodesulfovibrio paquesii]
MKDVTGDGEVSGQRPMVRGKAPWAAVAAGAVLLVVAALRWREQGWGVLVWLAAFAAMFIIRMPYSLRNRANVVVWSRKDTLEKVLLTSMFATMMLLPLLHLVTNCFAFAAYSLGWFWTMVGALLQLPFLALFWLSHAHLGANWSPGLELRQGHGLITHGIYGRIRHPMYAAIWISAVAQPLLIHNWIAGFLVLPACAALWFLRVPREEAMLAQQFGPAYADYCRVTGRLLPKRGRG